MTATDTQPGLWGSPCGDEKPARPEPPRCALCPARPETPFGLCIGCLRAAADELARITPRPADRDDPRPSAIAFRDLCARCGSWKHPASGCAA